MDQISASGCTSDDSYSQRVQFPQGQISPEQYFINIFQIARSLITLLLACFECSSRDLYLSYETKIFLYFISEQGLILIPNISLLIVKNSTFSTASPAENPNGVDC